jgi:pimeloyl-ACP methyl ester carboxylesterase
VIEARQILLTIGVTSASRILILRDRLLGRIGKNARMSTPQSAGSHQSIESGDHLLDAVFVTPDAGAVKASILICHGIGETVEHWLGVQQLLAADGVASLVFDYSGFGRSTGFFNARRCEQNAVAAFTHLQRLTGVLPVSVLGFSLGSGIATAIVPAVPMHSLMLCAAFTSLRKAAVSVGIPKSLSVAVPSIWDAEKALATCSVPVLVVHGEKDRLFPVEMAEELMSYCGPQSELVIVPMLTHNEPYYRPHLSYWGRITSWLL